MFATAPSIDDANEKWRVKSGIGARDAKSRAALKGEVMAANGSDSDLWVHEAFEERLRDTVRSLVSPALIAEHASDPRDPSDALTRVLEYLRRAPLAGKYVVVAAQWFSDYRIGVLSGGPGTPVEIGERSFATARDAYHEIFLMRLRELGVDWA